MMVDFRAFAATIPALLSLALLSGFGCSRHETGAAAAAPPAPPARFVDVAPDLGVKFRHTSGRSGRLYLAETIGSGCAFLDYNNDGRLDLFFVNSARLPGYPGKGPFYPALYRQRPDGAFEDVTRQAGLAVEIYAHGCAIGDYDNDGHADIYLACMGPDHLFRSNGDGTFSDVTRKAGVGDPKLGTSCAWFDYDRDGDLDLFVCNYCRWSPELNVVCRAAAWRHMCPPNHYQGQPSTLYRNNGNGTFTDVTRPAGVTSDVGKALGVMVWDVDDDGWLDFMVACDMEPNLLYRNNRDGTFTEIGVEAGCAYSLAGKARAGMGIDSGDYENNGREAVLIGNNSREGLALFRPDASSLPSPDRGGAGGGIDIRFTDAAEPAGLFQPSFPYLTFGAMFCDVDLDGWKDIVTANGHVNDVVEKFGTGIRYAERMQLFRNARGGRFVEVGKDSGPPFQDDIVARGLAVGDYDRDGDPDLLVNVKDGPARLLRNDLIPTAAPIQNPGAPAETIQNPKSKIQNPNHWLQVRLQGTRGNRDGIGSRVRLEAGGVRQTSWVRSGSSYCSSNDLKAYFGLGRASRIDRLEVRWPNGVTETVQDVPMDQLVTVREGHGILR